MGHPPRILLTRLSAHGDVAQTLPLLAALRQAQPDAFIGWLVERAAAPLLNDCPGLDALHICDRKQWLKQPLKPSSFTGPFQLISEIQKQHYDMAFDTQGLLKSAVWPFLAGIPKRYGYKKTRDMGTPVLYTDHLPPLAIQSLETHAVTQYLEFGRQAGLYDALPDVAKLRLGLPGVSAERAATVSGWLSKLDPSKPVIACAPATQWESKHWPESHWQNLLKALAPEVNLILLGGAGDIALTNRLAAADHFPNLIHLAGLTDWPDLYALLPHVDVLIGPDSAPLHVASVVASTQHKPLVIGLYGPTAPQRTGPTLLGGVPHETITTDVPCRPCFKRRCPLTHDDEKNQCLMQLTPETVLNRVRHALSIQQGISL